MDVSTFSFSPTILNPNQKKKKLQKKENRVSVFLFPFSIGYQAEETLVLSMFFCVMGLAVILHRMLDPSEIMGKKSKIITVGAILFTLLLTSQCHGESKTLSCFFISTFVLRYNYVLYIFFLLPLSPPVLGHRDH